MNPAYNDGSGAYPPPPPPSFPDAPTEKPQYNPYADDRAFPESASNANEYSPYNDTAWGQPPPQAPVEPYKMAPDGADAVGGNEDDPLLAAGNSGRFTSQGWKDWPFALLFVLHFVAMMILLAAKGKHLKDEGQPDHKDSSVQVDEIETSHIGLAVGSSFGFAVLACLFWVAVLKKYTKVLIWTSLLGGCVISIASAVVAIITKNVGVSIVMCFLVLVQLIYVYFIRHRIPFATALVQTVATCLNKYPATFFVAFAFTAVQFVWVVLWSLTAFAVYNSMSDEKNSTRGFVTFLLLLSFYWTCQVIKNVVHVTTAGLVATWYFLAETPGMFENPTQKSLKRACTTSFGSICLGSLIVAIIQAIRAMVEQGRKNNNTLVRCIFDCILHCLEGIIKFFNKYAYSLIAIYGMSFCEGAKGTWHLLERAGFDMVINDNMIGSALSFACLMSGLFCGALGAAVGYGAESENFTQGSWILFVLFGFLAGVGLTMQVMSVVDSGVATLFVCFAEDPRALKASKPEVFSNIVSAWEVRWGSPPPNCIGGV